jgi:DNA-binding NarL/FixJ family response regulator
MIDIGWRESALAAIAPKELRMRILVVDDQPVFAEAMGAWLQRESRRFVPQSAGSLEVTAIQTLASAFAELGKRPRPSLVLLDLRLTESKDATTLELFQKNNPNNIPVAVLTAIEPQEKGAISIFRRCMDLDAKAIILKTMAPSKMFVGLRRLLDEDEEEHIWLSNELMQACLGNDDKKGDKYRLTPREQEIAALVAQGCTNKEIAIQLGGLSPAYIGGKVGEILGKMQINTRRKIGGLLDNR